MDRIYDYKRYAILYVDDEEKSLKYFARAFADKFRILTATNAADGYRLLEDHQDEIGVVMSDQRMPGEKGVQFLERARHLRPRIIRILATAFADLEAAIDAVNSGAIYKYITKPWDPTELETTLKRSLEFFCVQCERDFLLREKLSALHRMVITDRVLSLGVLAAGLGQQLRNAMDAIRTFLDLAPEMLHRDNLDLTQLRHPAFWQDFHRNIQARLRLILELLDDLSAVGAPPAGALVLNDAPAAPYRAPSKPELVPVSIYEAIQRAVQDLQAEFAQRRIQVSNLVSPQLPPVRVDAHRFGKLFRLLLQEELSNLQDGALIRFEAMLRPEADGKPAELDIVMNDNGPGLPSDAILSLFDPLVIQKQRPADFGIYLMACYFIIYHHGGRVQLRQGTERGLAMTISLPLQPPDTNGGLACEEFLMRAMTNERLWERLLAGV